MGGFAVPLVRAVAGVLAAVAALPAVALAHGPCGCLEPASGPPGTRVHAAYPIYKVIFNPDRSDLSIGPESLWRRHRGGPPVTVYRRTWRYSRRPRDVRDPARVARPLSRRALRRGESGVHYSWETFTVTRGHGCAGARHGGVERRGPGVGARRRGGGRAGRRLRGGERRPKAGVPLSAPIMRLRGLEPPRA